MDQLILAKLVSRSSSPNQHINRFNPANLLAKMDTSFLVVLLFKNLNP
jgi:hypothetical protein